MAASQASPAVQAVLTALDALYTKPGKEEKNEANNWLQNFQKTVGAGEGCCLKSFTTHTSSCIFK
jgi:hypothetical protein